MDWFLDWFFMRNTRSQPPQPVPKTEQELAFELVLELLRTPEVEFKRHDDPHEVWSQLPHCYVYKHWLTNDQAMLSVQVEVDRGGTVRHVVVWVGSVLMELTGTQHQQLIRLLNDHIIHAADIARQKQTREQLRLLVEAAERLL